VDELDTLCRSTAKRDEFFKSATEMDELYNSITKVNELYKSKPHVDRPAGHSPNGTTNTNICLTSHTKVPYSGGIPGFGHRLSRAVA
jgi:hypothetical protein